MTTEEPTGTTIVKMGAEALLRITLHCEEAPGSAIGHLIGVSQQNEIQIFFSYPFSDIASYSRVSPEQNLKEMLRYFEGSHFEKTEVGWYYKPESENFIDEGSINKLYQMQSNLPSATMVIFNPTLNKKGELPIKCYQLTQEFMQYYQSKNYTISQAKINKLNSSNILK